MFTLYVTVLTSFQEKQRERERVQCVSSRSTVRVSPRPAASIKKKDRLRTECSFFYYYYYFDSTLIFSQLNDFLRRIIQVLEIMIFESPELSWIVVLCALQSVLHCRTALR